MLNSYLESTYVKTEVFIIILAILWMIENGLAFRPKRNEFPFANLALTFLTIGIFSLLGKALVISLEYFKQIHFGIFHWINEEPLWLVVLIGILFLDFWAAWFVHFLLHKIKWFWPFHSIHHFDIYVDASTALRQHPIETCIRFVFLFSGAILLGLPFWVVTLYQFFSSTNALLEHANFKYPIRIDNFLNKILVTPGFHKIHHSKHQSETDSNYGNIFSIWDYCFKTANVKRINELIAYGLDYKPKIHIHSLVNLLRIPFLKN